MPTFKKTPTKGSSTATAPHSKSTAVAKATTTKADAIDLVFRRAVTEFLTTSMNPSADKLDKMEVLAQAQRLSADGRQQTMQLCQSGGEKWIMSTEGGRKYFPQMARAKRVLEEVKVDDSTDDEDADVEENVPRAPAKKRSKSSATGKGRKPSTTTTVSRKGKGRAASSARDPEEDDAEDDLPATANAISTPIVRRTHIHAVPSAPARRRRHAAAHEDTATLIAAAGPTSLRDLVDRAQSAEETEDAMRARVQEALGRGLRRSTRSVASGADDVFTVKTEETTDELASLCGKIGGLEVASIVEAESNLGTPIPQASTSKA